jgi:hypothetical protein
MATRQDQDDLSPGALAARLTRFIEEAQETQSKAAECIALSEELLARLSPVPIARRPRAL